MKDTISPNVSVAALRKIIQRKNVCRAAAAKPRAQLHRTNLRGAAHPELDKRLYHWFCMLSARGRKRVPMTYALWGRKAEEIASELGITAFFGSLGYVQGWAGRHGVVNVRLHGLRDRWIWRRRGSAWPTCGGGWRRLTRSTSTTWMSRVCFKWLSQTARLCRPRTDAVYVAARP